MKKLTLKNKIYISLFGLAFIFFGYILGLNIVRTLGVNPVANTAGEPVSLIGTKLGTTTTPVIFYTRTASTTYPFRIGADKDKVMLYLETFATTTTGNLNDVSYSILASNDNDCNTATTTTVYNVVTTNQINWFDASAHILNTTAITNQSFATSSYTWAGKGQKQGKEIILTELNAKCLALEVSASSTPLYVEFMAK